jgi:hypothetical protein
VAPHLVVEALQGRAFQGVTVVDRHPVTAIVLQAHLDPTAHAVRLARKRETIARTLSPRQRKKGRD